MADNTVPTSPRGASEAGLNNDLQQIERVLVADDAIVQALPFPDVAFGGGMLVLVIMLHAFFIRLITSSFLKQSQQIRARAMLWRADLLFALMVLALLSLHLAEVVLWSAGLVLAEIVPNWGRAAYFAANCYTTMGEPFVLPHDWRIVPPIIAMSGIFATAWTASVLVNFVARYNDLRAGILTVHQRKRAERKAKT